MLRLSHLNSNNMATDWSSEGAASVKAMDEAFAGATAAIANTAATSAGANAASALRDARLAWERAEKHLGFAIAATDMEPLKTATKQVSDQILVATKATQDAAAALSPLGVAPGAVNAAAERLSKALGHASEVVAGAGKPEQDARYVEDAWSDAIAKYLNGLAKKRTTIGVIAQDALGIEMAHLGPPQTLRICGVLTKLGWGLRRSNGVRGYEPKPEAVA